MEGSEGGVANGESVLCVQFRHSDEDQWSIQVPVVMVQEHTHSCQSTHTYFTVKIAVILMKVIFEGRIVPNTGVNRSRLLILEP